MRQLIECHCNGFCGEVDLFYFLVTFQVHRGKEKGAFLKFFNHYLMKTYLNIMSEI